MSEFVYLFPASAGGWREAMGTPKLLDEPGRGRGTGGGNR
jgi:hypothetical protein